MISMSISKRMGKRSCFIHTAGCYSAANRNELQVLATTWMNLKNVCWMKKSQTRKSTYLSIPCIWSLRNDNSNLLVIELRAVAGSSGEGGHKEWLEIRRNRCQKGSVSCWEGGLLGIHTCWKSMNDTIKICAFHCM